MESLFDDSICCKLCGEVFDTPIILSACGHSICFKCAEASLSFQQLKKQNTGSYIICPTCSKSTPIPSNTQIKDFLKPNYDLRDVIEKLKKGNSVLCDNECGSSANAVCENCAANYCEPCFKDCHSKAAQKNHKKLPLGEAKNKSNSTCSKHNEELKLFCRKCNIPVCLMCYGFGDHKGHECVVLTDYSDSIRSEVMKGAKELNSRATILQDVTQAIQKEMTAIKQTHEKFDSDVEQLCRELTEMISNKKQQLLNSSLEIKAKKLNKLQEQFDKVKNSSEKILQLSKEYETLASSSKNSLEIAHLGQSTKAALQQFNLNDFPQTPCANSMVAAKLNSEECKKTILLLGDISDIAPPPTPKSPPKTGNSSSCATGDTLLEDLRKIEPVLQEAKEAVGSIKKQHLDELRALARPPFLVLRTLEAVGLLIHGYKQEWAELRKLIAAPTFISTVVNFDGSNITEKIRASIEDNYFSDISFNFETVCRCSKACGALFKWITAQMQFADILNRAQLLL